MTSAGDYQIEASDFEWLVGFLNEEEYTGVVETMKLKDGNIMGLPIVMDTDDDSVAVGDKLLLEFEVRARAREAHARPLPRGRKCVYAHARHYHQLKCALVPLVPLSAGHPDGRDDG